MNSAANQLEEAFEAAMDDLMQFVAEDAIRSSIPMPSGRGCYDPDGNGRDRCCEALRQAARAAFARQSQTPAAVVNNGLFTVHDPDARYVTANGAPL